MRHTFLAQDFSKVSPNGMRSPARSWREGCSQMPISRDVPGNSAPDIKLTNGPQYIRESKIRLSRPPVNQMPMFRDCTWGPKYALRKAVNPVNSAPQGRRSSVEGGSTYVVVGETW